MINKAIAKVTEEAMALNNKLAFFIEETVTNNCKTQEDAENVLNEEKSIKKLIKQITAEAKANASANVGCVSYSEVEEMTLEYFNLHRSGADEGDVMNIFDYM